MSLLLPGGRFTAAYAFDSCAGASLLAVFTSVSKALISSRRMPRSLIFAFTSSRLSRSSVQAAMVKVMMSSAVENLMDSLCPLPRGTYNMHDAANISQSTYLLSCGKKYCFSAFPVILFFFTEGSPRPPSGQGSRAFYGPLSFQPPVSV